ncbi:MAG: DUF5706 domain-containing protein [Eubacteriales bacterium]|nr:DUF5706 domain-containing protein [Eubacteriales bacterium]
MEKNEKRDELNQILDRNIAWIENCDSKTSIVLGCIGIIAGILLAADYVSRIIAIFRNFLETLSFWSVTYLIIAYASICTVAAGCLCLLLVLVAKINLKEFAAKGVRTDSLIYFSSIARIKTMSSYKSKLRSMKDDELEEDLISQIYICSIICSKKFARYKIGLLLSVLGLISFAAMIIIGLIVI